MSARLPRRQAVATLLGLVIAPALMPRRAMAADELICGKIHEVAIKGFAFEPAELEVSVGDCIRWSNADLSPHTATADDGSWDTGAIEQGASGSLAVTAGMATDYHCDFHPQMLAKLVIVTA